MYILAYYEDDREYPWLCFDTIEDGREFLSLINGYDFTTDELGIDSEWINTTALLDYQEIAFKGNVVPVSRFMFKNTGRVELAFYERINLSIPNQGMVQDSTRVDAYFIPNNEVKTYIENREKGYLCVKSILEEKGMCVARAYHGSEDGEAILYKKDGINDWFFLTHLDPGFVELYKEGEEEVRQVIKGWLD